MGIRYMCKISVGSTYLEMFIESCSREVLGTEKYENVENNYSLMVEINK
jgi:hypothetical protein